MVNSASDGCHDNAVNARLPWQRSQRSVAIATRDANVRSIPLMLGVAKLFVALRFRGCLEKLAIVPVSSPCLHFRLGAVEVTLQRTHGFRVRPIIFGDGDLLSGGVGEHEFLALFEGSGVKPGRGVKTGRGSNRVGAVIGRDEAGIRGFSTGSEIKASRTESIDSHIASILTVIPTQY